MAEYIGMAAAVRAVLEAADDSMAQSDVAAAIKAKGRPFSSNDIGSVLRARTKAGEFIRNQVDGVWKYTTNPEWKPSNRGVKVGNKPPNAPHRRAPASILAPSLGVAVPDAELDAGVEALAGIPMGGPRRLDETLVSAPRAIVPEPDKRKKPPFALVERLAAISMDIEDALGDACDAQLSHELIKGLVVANGAIARVSRLVSA